MCPVVVLVMYCSLIHVWIVGFLATAVKTQDDPRILSLRSQRRQLEEDWREQKWSKMCSLFITVLFELLWWSGFCHAISCRTALIWRTCAVWKQQSTGPARNQPLWLESWNGSWRRGKGIGSTDFHWSTGASQSIYRKHHLLLLVR